MFGMYSLSKRNEMMNERLQQERDRTRAGERFGRGLYNAMLSSLKDASDYRTQSQKNTEK